MEIKINSKNFTDKDILSDSLYSQRHMSECYNRFAEDCSDQKLRDEIVNILCEEHQLLADVFSEMKKRGYISNSYAEALDIKAIKQKYAKEIKKNLIFYTG